MFNRTHFPHDAGQLVRLALRYPSINIQSVDAPDPRVPAGDAGAGAGCDRECQFAGGGPADPGSRGVCGDQGLRDELFGGLAPGGA